MKIAWFSGGCGRALLHGKLIPNRKLRLQNKVISRHFFRNIIHPVADNTPGWNITGLGRTPWLSTGWVLILAAVLAIFEGYFIISDNLPIAVGLALMPAVVLFVNYPFAALIFWLLATPFLQNTTSDQSRTIYWIVYRALPLLALCSTLLVNRLRSDNNSLRLRIGKDGLAMVVFLGWVLVNIFWYHPSGYLSHAYTLYDQSFVPFCLYWWVRITAPNEKDLNRLIPGFIVLVIFEVAVGLVSWVRPGILPSDWVGYTSERTIGTLRFVHAYSLTLLLFSLLLFQTAMNRKSKATRLTLLCVVGVGVAGIFLFFARCLARWDSRLGRGFFLYPKSVFRLTVVLLILMAILGSTVLYKEMTFAEERLNSEQTAKVRLVIWDAGMQMIQLKPFLGWGYGDYSLYAGKFQRRILDTTATKQHASHNTFISFAAELGVPGLLLYLFPAMLWLVQSFKMRQHLPQTGFWSQKLLIIFWLFLIAHSIVSFFSDIRTSTYGISLWWVTLGLIATMVDPYRAHDGRTA